MTWKDCEMLFLLHHILGKEDCKIQLLDLRANRISHDSIMKFANKIWLFKSLRRLHLNKNLFDNSLYWPIRSPPQALQPLLNRLADSKSLERVLVHFHDMDATELCHAMNVNQGGRYGIEMESANHGFSLSSWPRIFHRALSSIGHFDTIHDFSYEDVRKPTDKSPRASVVFSLLRDHPNIFEYCGKA